jgi:uncharacterized protein (TIGR02246 family)
MCYKSMTSLIAVLLSLSAGQATAQQTPDQPAAEQQISMLHRQWVEAVENKDIDTIVDLYAKDGVIMPPNAESVQGSEAIRKSWAELLQSPNASFAFEPTTIRTNGDMAYEIGSYSLSFRSDAGRGRRHRQIRAGLDQGGRRLEGRGRHFQQQPAHAK